MLGYCQSAASATVAETAQVEARTAHYFLFVTAATDRPGINGRLLADRSYKMIRGVEITSGKALA